MEINIDDESRNFLLRAASLIQRLLLSQEDKELTEHVKKLYGNGIKNYISILECAIKLKPDAVKILDEFKIPDEDTRYFAISETEVREARKIPNTMLHANSNLSNPQKRIALMQALQKIGFTRETAWIAAESL
jgi:hypothetical protein